VIVKLDDFGTVSLITGASEIGQGSETVLAMIVAETLGVPLERVQVVNSDTTVKPWDVGVHASRTTFIAGNAARLAALELRGKLLAMAREQLDEPVERLNTRASSGSSRNCWTCESFFGGLMLSRSFEPVPIRSSLISGFAGLMVVGYL